MSVPNTPDQRAGYISGLRKLADLLEQTPDLELPYNGSGPGHGVQFIPIGSNAKEQLALLARVLPGKKVKHVRDEWFDLLGQIDGLYVRAIATRSEVCERVVVGTETVEVEEREGEDTRPVVKRTETRDVVEWRCGSLLADDSAETVAS